MKYLLIVSIVSLLNGCVFATDRSKIKVCNGSQDTAFVSVIQKRNQQQYYDAWEKIEPTECNTVRRDLATNELFILAVDNDWKKFNILQTEFEKSVFISNKETKKCIPPRVSGVQIPLKTQLSKNKCTKDSYGIGFISVYHDANYLIIQ
jgi:Protein of unknown function (DUF1036)